MMNAIQKLLEIAGPSLTDSPVTGLGLQLPELEALLRMKNGFFAFESALHVFPAADGAASYSLDDWNASALWRNDYGDLAEGGLICFAEDILGTQFCLKENQVYSFDPETAEMSLMGNTLEEWAAEVLKDYCALTGYPLAHEWQVKNGVLAARERLMPRVPFVLGGEFGIDNLVAIEGARSMRCRAHLARQIHSLPDGAQIRFALVD